MYYLDDSNPGVNDTTCRVAEKVADHVTADALSETRMAVFLNGYRPVPISGIRMNVKSPGKQPVLKDWREKCAVADEQTILSWSTTSRDCTNTGLMTGISGGIVAADIDVLIPAISDEIADLACELLGLTPLQRIGKAPKLLNVYRVDRDFRKVKTPAFIMPDGTTAQVEFLAEGQQFVAFGDHPDTRQPYQWVDQSPADVPVTELPIVDLEAAETFIDCASQVLRKHGGVPKQPSGKTSAAPTTAAGKPNKGPAPAVGDNFFRNVNNAALANMEPWVQSLFPGIAHYNAGSETYRIRSADLGRDLEEDISFHPTGSYDFGLEKSITPIDAVIDRGSAADAKQAAHWLCEKMGIDPVSLGWSEMKVKPTHQPNADDAKMAYAASVAAPATATDEPVTGLGDREIQIVAGELPRIVDDAEAALIAAKSPVYQRGSILVTVGQTLIKTREKEVIGPRILPLVAPALIEHMTLAATWQKYDRRSESWVRTDCPSKIAETYLARGTWKVRPLAGIIEAPMMRCDGSILDQPGYDPATALILLGNVKMPPIKEHPTRADAEAALEVLMEPISSFPFAEDTDRAVALSGMLTAISRRGFSSAPLHAFTAPVAGSGKGKLVDIISTIATGRAAAVTSPGKTEEEAEKRLGSSLLSGDPIISIDNLNQPLDGELLCQSLTQPTLRIRMLGHSLNVEVPSIAAMFATGNNLAIQGDMTRRTVVCKIDPGCERPELREFDFDPIAMVGADRGKYIAAALTIMRAYVVAGFPGKLKPLGSFEDWSNHVRSALVWLGEADPVDTMDDARENDPVLSNIRAVMNAWAEVVSDHEQVTASKLVTYATTTVQSTFGGPVEYAHEALREALLTVASAGGTISTRSLGKWMRTHAGRVVDGMRIVVAHADAHNGARYLLEKVSKN